MPSHVADIWGDPAFTFTSLTAAANDEPFVPGQVGKLGIFQEEGVDTTSIEIEELDGRLSLVAPSSRGGPGETVAHAKRRVRMFPIPHFQRDEMVRADEVQNVRAFGSTDNSEAIQKKVQQKLARHYQDLDATMEHQRMGAVKGIVYDKNGQVMSNLYQEFGITKPAVVSFDLSSPDLKVRELTFEIATRMEDALEKTIYTGIHAMVGNDFWIALLENEDVKKSYYNTQQAAELRGDPMKERFEYGGITWERYRVGNQAKKATKGSADFMAANEARFFPKGVNGLFLTRFAPADYIETVNSMGLPRYVKPVLMRNGKGMEFEIQSNPLNICTKPGVLIEGRLA